MAGTTRCVSQVKCRAGANGCIPFPEQGQIDLLPASFLQHLEICFLCHISSLNFSFEFTTSTWLASFSVDWGEKGTQEEKAGGSSSLLCHTACWLSF